MLNHHIEIGRLAQDPELQYTQEGTPFCEFALADDRTKRDETQFVNIIAWGEGAENHAQYLSKGDIAAAIGALDLGKWTDDEGNTRFSPQIKARNVVYLGSGSSDSEGSSNEKPDEPKPDTGDDEEIPF